MEVLNWDQNSIDRISEYLLSGKVVVLPTDTLYGLVALAENIVAVENVYEVRSRNLQKKCIVLISSMADLDLFEINLSAWQRQELTRMWPGKYSVELACNSEKFAHLRRGTTSLSFRYPKDDLLCELLAKTGPLIAPSANPEGLEPALDIDTAKEYFGKKVDVYVNAGQKNSLPSTIVSLLDDKLEVIRK